MRLLEVRGEQGAAELEAALLASGGPLAPLDAAGRRAVVERLEREHAQLFTLVRNAAYVAYYESPAVVRAVAGAGPALPGDARQGRLPDAAVRPRRATGRPHGRGGYVRTDDVQRLDLGELHGGAHGARVTSPPTS